MDAMMLVWVYFDKKLIRITMNQVKDLTQGVHRYVFIGDMNFFQVGFTLYEHASLFTTYPTSCMTHCGQSMTHD